MVSSFEVRSMNTPVAKTISTPLLPMPYSQKIIELIGSVPETTGTRLGKWAVRRDISMQKIADLTGATRQTVYNWFTGKTEVTQAYQERVINIIEVLKNTTQKDDAWRILCTAFNLKR